MYIYLMYCGVVLLLLLIYMCVCVYIYMCVHIAFIFVLIPLCQTMHICVYHDVQEY